MVGLVVKCKHAKAKAYSAAQYRKPQKNLFGYAAQCVLRKQFVQTARQKDKCRQSRVYQKYNNCPVFQGITSAKYIKKVSMQGWFALGNDTTKIFSWLYLFVLLAGLSA